MDMYLSIFSAYGLKEDIKNRFKIVCCRKGMERANYFRKIRVFLNFFRLIKPWANS